MSCNPGKRSRNPYLNYLREFRRKNCHLSAVEIVRQGAEQWRKMTDEQKLPFIRTAFYTAMRPRRCPACRMVMGRSRRAGRVVPNPVSTSLRNGEPHWRPPLGLLVLVVVVMVVVVVVLMVLVLVVLLLLLLVMMALIGCMALWIVLRPSHGCGGDRVRMVRIRFRRHHPTGTSAGPARQLHGSMPQVMLLVPDVVHSRGMARVAAGRIRPVPAH
uniref:Uncharacterized protein n=1 Tax=Anopheles atroparvus TaxID=41427 RepID=A0A182IMI9_ANOAO